MKRIGIIGCGKIAQTRHIPEYASNKDVTLSGYYDFNFERAKKIADAYGGKAYETLDALLADSQIDAVSVCVANHAHSEITIKALKSGKDVLCEKPMATTIEECEEMVREAVASQKKLMIGHNQRLAKAHTRAKELILQGAIGEIITFKTTFGHGGPETWSVDSGKNNWFFDKKKASMGALADLGVHKTDLIQFLTGQNVVETTAKVVTLDKRDANGNFIGVDDNAICIYQMKNGIIGTMTASWTYYGKEDNSTILYGTKGIMKLYDNPDFSIELISSNGEKIFYDIDQIQTNDNQTNSGIIDAFIECLEKDQEPLISGKSVLPAMRTVFSSIESSEKGISIHIPENE